MFIECKQIRTYNLSMKRLFYLLLSLLIISCSDLILETDSVEVQTIKSGEVLRVGDNFQIVLVESSDTITANPSSLEILFSHINGSRDTLNDPIEVSVDLGENPEPSFLISDDFEDGLYRVDITVYDTDTILTEYSADFFVYSGDFSGQIKNVYPLKDLYTDSAVILESQISIDEVDPYLIWRFGDEILREGYLSDGLDTIIWNSADNFGFVNIRLDIYPYWIDNQDILSSFYIEFPFVVNSISTTLVDTEILSQYGSYFQFNGNYIDEVNKELDISVIGELKPSIINEIYGMSFDTTRGYSRSVGLLPQEHFSLITRFVVESLEDGFVFQSWLGDINLTLRLESGSLIHDLSVAGLSESGGDTISYMDSGEVYDLQVNYILMESRYRYFIYLDGELMTEGISSEISTLVGDEEESSEGVVVGSSDSGLGANFLLDLLMVYNYDINGSSNILSVYESDAAYFNSFQSAYLPANYTGEGYVTGEVLVMKADDEFTIDLILNNSDFDMMFNGENLDLIVNFGGLEINITSSGMIKRRGDALFLDETKIEGFTLDIENIIILAQSESQIDSITVDLMDLGIEE